MAPWPSTLLAALMIGLFLVQSAFFADQRALIEAWGLVPAFLGREGGLTLLTYMLLHDGWMHVGFNAAAAFVLGAPVARMFGRSLTGALPFFLFFLICGAAAAAAYGLLFSGSVVPVIGASGAVAGLFGAAVRGLGRRGGEIGPVMTPAVVAVTCMWVIVNLSMAFLPGAGDLGEGRAVAWQVHIAGYLVGLLLIGPYAAVFRALARTRAVKRAAREDARGEPAN